VSIMFKIGVTLMEMLIEGVIISVTNSKQRLNK
jgi:hypothetical protein